MALNEVQQLLAQLYTDAEARHRFFVEQGGSSAHSAARRDLAGLSEGQVSFFACSLQHKRFGEIRKMFPRGSRVLGWEFNRLLQEYVRKQGHVPPSNRLEDALEFAAFAQSALAQQSTRRWIRELLCFEAASLKAKRGRFLLRIRCFRFSIYDLLHCAEGAARNPPPFRSTLVIWMRLTPRSPLQRFSFSLPRTACRFWRTSTGVNASRSWTGLKISGSATRF